jgi:hypothetical protein
MKNQALTHVNLKNWIIQISSVISQRIGVKNFSLHFQRIEFIMFGVSLNTRGEFITSRTLLLISHSMEFS